MKGLISSDLKKVLESTRVGYYQLLIHWWPNFFCITINPIIVDRKSHTYMPTPIYLNGTATLDCSVKEKLERFSASAARGDLQENWNALLAGETIVLKPVRRSKLRDSVSKLKAASSRSKQGRRREYKFWLRGNFMCRLKQEGKKAKLRSKGIPINLKNLEIRLDISIQR